jgi:hypothetical protein
MVDYLRSSSPTSLRQLLILGKSSACSDKAIVYLILLVQYFANLSNILLVQA